ncbi:MAG TPA: hypothetical protein VEY30_06365 [Myxococcaceae bacterium]|nr:hypothetical protein [Myxococcaceae bacterium]
MSREARALAKRLAALSGGPEVRRKAAARELGALDPTDATALLDRLFDLSRQGFEPASDALAACCKALELELEQIPYAHALKRIADLQDLDRVSALFPRASAKEQMDAGAAAKADARQFSESLGHLKTKARTTRDPDVLTRLSSFSNPWVVRNVLLNPRATEALVVRIAARRPTRPEPLLEVCRSPRWSVSHAVRRALVFNPYLPPDAGAKILPLLTRAEWSELLKAPDVHDALRVQARRLLDAEEVP